MRARRVSRVPFVMVAAATATATGIGCQLLYDKNELTVSTGGAGGTTTTTTITGGTGGSTVTTGGGGTTSSTGGSTGGTTSSGGSTGGTTSSGGSTGGTTSSGGSTGGTTSSGGTGGTTGSGGDMDGGMGGADGGDCSGDRLFVVGTSASNIVCGTYAPMGGWSVATDASASSNERPAAQLVDASTGAGVVFTAPGPVRSITLANGVCGSSAPLQGFSSKAPPSAAALGGKVHAILQGAAGAGTDHPFHTIWDPQQGWSAPVQINMDVFSDSVAALASSNQSLLAVYGGGDTFLYRLPYSGSWGSVSCFLADPPNAGCTQTDKAVTPAVTFLSNGNWLVVYKEPAPSTKLVWLAFDGAMNTKPTVIANALSASPVGLARVAGGAVLAFRGTNDGVYATVFDQAMGTWGAIAQVGTATTTAPPAVAAGVCAHEAEVVFVDAADAGKIKHSSRDAGLWGAPVLVGGSQMKGVGLASSR